MSAACLPTGTEQLRLRRESRCTDRSAGGHDRDGPVLATSSARFNAQPASPPNSSAAIRDAAPLLITAHYDSTAAARPSHFARRTNASWARDLALVTGCRQACTQQMEKRSKEPASRRSAELAWPQSAPAATTQLALPPSPGTTPGTPSEDSRFPFTPDFSLMAAATLPWFTSHGTVPGHCRRQPTRPDAGMLLSLTTSAVMPVCITVPRRRPTRNAILLAECTAARVVECTTVHGGG